MVVIVCAIAEIIGSPTPVSVKYLTDIYCMSISKGFLLLLYVFQALELLYQMAKSRKYVTGIENGEVCSGSFSPSFLWSHHI